MTHLTNTLAALSIAAALLIAGTTGISADQRASTQERFHALAIQPAGGNGPTTLQIDLTITRWSTPAEQDAMRTTLLEQPKNALDVLRKMPEVGRIETPGNVGYALRYAQKSSAGGTDRILLLTDRPVGFAEAAVAGRTLDYPITVIELRVQPSGKGEGKIAVAARLIPNRMGRELMVEDWNFTPVLLQGVQRER